MQAFQLQNQIRQNASARFNYLNDLHSWQNSAEQTDKTRSKKRKKSAKKKVLPPIRGTFHDETEEKSPENTPREPPQPPKSNTSAASHTHGNYSKWNKICDDIDNEELETRTTANRTVINSDTQPARDASDHGSFCTSEQLREEGNQFFRLGKFSLAIEHYTKALKLSPNDVTILCNRAMAQLKCCNYEAAELDCTKCIELDETNVKAWFRRGLARKNLKKRKQARHDFDKVSKLDENNIGARRERQEIARQLKLLKEKKRAQKAANPNEFRRIPVETFWEEDQPLSEYPTLDSYGVDSVPTDFEEFECQWRVGCSVSRRCSLLETMWTNGTSLVVIVGKMLDDSLLSGLLEAINILCERQSEYATELFSQLSQIDRFSMLTMFLDDEHRTILERIKDYTACVD